MSKIQKPKFIDELEDVGDFDQYDFDGEKVQNKMVEGISISDRCGIGTTVDSCIFKNVIFADCDFKNIDLIDVRFENCDLSNISLRGGSIHRVEFVNCKLVGARLDESNMKDVLFNNVLGPYSNFSYSKLQNVSMEESNLEESIFQEVNHKNIIFKESNLSNSYFNKTQLDKVDFTSCEITGIDVDIESVRGVIVTSYQALDLTRLMGIVIR